MEAKYSKGGKRSQNTPPVNTQTPPNNSKCKQGSPQHSKRGQHHPDTNTSTGSQLLQQKEKKRKPKKYANKTHTLSTKIYQKENTEIRKSIFFLSQNKQ